MMRRRLILGASSLLLAGAAVNIALAWIIAVRAPYFLLSSDDVTANWFLPTPEEWPIRSTVSAFSSSRGAALRGQYHIVWEEGDQTTFAAERFEVGWPLRALYCGRLQRRHYPAQLTGARVSLEHDAPIARLLAGAPLPGSMAPASLVWPQQRLPIAPLLPGFAINTLFYTALLALPLTFFPLRRHLRTRRGRCPKCGYDRAGLANPATPCPECGATR